MAANEITTLPFHPQSQISLTATIENFSRYLEAQLGLPQNTILSYSSALTDFEHWLKNPAIRAKRAQIYAYIAETTDKLSPTTAGHRLSVLRTFFAFALDRKLVRKDPTANMRGPKRPQKLPERPISTSEVRKMLGAAGRRTAKGLRARVILLLGFDQGMRESEMAALRLDAVSVEDGILRIRNGKGGKSATLPLLSLCAEAIREYMAKGRPEILGDRDSPFLLVGREGSQVTRQTIYNTITDLGWSALGRKTSPHRLRSGFCTTLNERGMDLRTVQTFMRHADLSSTQRYIGLDTNQLRREYYRAFPRAHRQ